MKSDVTTEKRTEIEFAENVLELIGDTPLIRLGHMAEGCTGTVLAKLEYLNPGGSVKDRIGISMIEAAEKEGLLKPGGTIVEPTSGNTGVGLALAASLRGYKCIFTMPDKMSMEKELLLRAYGAEVVRTPTAVEPDDERSYYKVAERIVKETPNSFSPNQYFNPHNPEAHYRTTGPEIWRQTAGKITHFVAGMGTGGTVTGIARYLKEQNPDIKIIGSDPEGSIYADRKKGLEGKPYSYMVEGIGEDFMPATMDLDLVDEIIVVNDRQSFLRAREAVQKEGLLIGGSGGAALEAAMRVVPDLKEDDVMVILIPDSGKSYLSTFLNDEWMKENRFI